MKNRYPLYALFFSFLTILAVTSAIAGDLEEGKRMLKNKDYANAYTRLEKTARAGDAEAQFLVGFMNEEGEGIPKNAKKAAEWYLKSAKQGNVQAQNNLAGLYQDGQGVKKDAAQAMKWYSAAAEQNSASAQYNLGLMYEYGEGVPKDEAKAFQLFLKSAQQGDEMAQYSVGRAYRKGFGVKQDNEKGVEWYRKAGEKGHLKAQESLCAIDVQNQKWDDAFKWCEMADKQSSTNPNVSSGLGMMYLMGKGTQINNEKAFQYLSKLSEKGIPQADYALGTMYDYGFYVTRDITKAKAYYEKAAAGGVESAKKRLKELD